MFRLAKKVAVSFIWLMWIAGSIGVMGYTSTWLGVSGLGAGLLALMPFLAEFD